MTRNKKPIPPNERKLRRKLCEVTEQIARFILVLDAEMQRPSTVERGQRIAALLNQLEMYNDGVRIFWCGKSYRKPSTLPASRRALRGA